MHPPIDHATRGARASSTNTAVVVVARIDVDRRSRLVDELAEQQEALRECRAAFDEIAESTARLEALPCTIHCFGCASSADERRA